MKSILALFMIIYFITLQVYAQNSECTDKLLMKPIPRSEEPVLSEVYIYPASEKASIGLVSARIQIVYGQATDRAGNPENVAFLDNISSDVNPEHVHDFIFQVYNLMKKKGYKLGLPSRSVYSPENGPKDLPRNIILHELISSMKESLYQFVPHRVDDALVATADLAYAFPFVAVYNPDNLAVPPPEGNDVQVRRESDPPPDSGPGRFGDLTRYERSILDIRNKRDSASPFFYEEEMSEEAFIDLFKLAELKNFDLIVVVPRWRDRENPLDIYNPLPGRRGSPVELRTHIGSVVKIEHSEVEGIRKSYLVLGVHSQEFKRIQFNGPLPLRVAVIKKSFMIVPKLWTRLPFQNKHQSQSVWDQAKALAGQGWIFRADTDIGTITLFEYEGDYGARARASITPFGSYFGSMPNGREWPQIQVFIPEFFP